MDWHYFIICSTLVNPFIGKALVKALCSSSVRGVGCGSAEDERSKRRERKNREPRTANQMLLMGSRFTKKAPGSRFATWY